MKLGILVNSNKHGNDVLGIVKSALSKGHEVIIFNMDEGTKLLGNPAFTELCKTKGVKMAFCDHSAKELNTLTEGLSKEIVCGSQYDNALMHHEADRMIVL